MNPSNNLLIRLIKWAKRQEENYLTEAMAHLVESLRSVDNSLACDLLQLLTGGLLQLKMEELNTVEIVTQAVESSGRPDLVIRTTGHLFFIEVKKEARVRESQLLAYREQLSSYPDLKTGLVLLTRYPLLASVRGMVDTHVRWFEIADLLEYSLSQKKLRDPVLSATVEQFVGLLTERGLTMTQVSWELSAGLKALSNLRLMLAEAATANGLAATTFANKVWSGIKIGKDYWAGIDFDAPTILCVGTLRAVEDTDAAEQLGLSLYGDSQVWQSIDLESEQVHFFARSRASQLRFLESYLKDSMAILKKLKLRAGTVPAEDDEDM